MGYLAENVLKSGTGVDIPWWVFALAGLALTWVLIYRGIAISTKTAVLLGSLELLIMVALSISLLVSLAHATTGPPRSTCPTRSRASTASGTGSCSPSRR